MLRCVLIINMELIKLILSETKPSFLLQHSMQLLPRLHGAKIRDRDPDRNPDPDKTCRVNT